MFKVISICVVWVAILLAGLFANVSSASAASGVSSSKSNFEQAPYVEPLVKQILSNSSNYQIGKVQFTRIGNASNALSNIYYMGSDGISNLLVRNPGKDFSALLNYNNRSYKLTANKVTVIVDNFAKSNTENDSHSDTLSLAQNFGIQSTSEAQTNNTAFKYGFLDSYQMSRRKGTQSTQSIKNAKPFYANFDSHAVKNVRVVVSENAIIEELENYGEFNFASLYERIQNGIDFANLSLVSSGVDDLQLQTSEVVVQRLPKDYKGQVIEEDTFKRVAFPLWGEGDATFQMTALALTQNYADVIYNIGARELFRANTCGLANVGVNGSKSDTSAYSTHHTYPVAITIKRGCETGRAPVHEFGHTIGLNHERDNSGGKFVSGMSIPYAYNFGYTSLEAPAYSIMSYGLACKESQPSISCTPSNFFSSPKVKYGDAPLGIPKPDPEAADAVRFLNDTWGLRFSNHINPMNISPEPSGGFTIAWDTNSSDVQSQLLVFSDSSHSRYNYVLDNHVLSNHQKIEIPLLANQSSYSLTLEKMHELGLHNNQYDTISLFTGHLNNYDDIVPNLHAQLHAGDSLLANINNSAHPLIALDGKNVHAPEAGDTITFTFNVSGIENLGLDDVKLMTVLDSQYNAHFTTAITRREYNRTNPMLDFVTYELYLLDENKVQMSLTLSPDYRDYVGFLTNRETSNFKLPVVGFYLDYLSNQNGFTQQTKSQEVAIDLRNALKAVPFIQAETFAQVIDNDRQLPLSVMFSSTQEIAPSDVNAVIEAASAYQIGDMVTTWRQLPDRNNKYRYAVTIENPNAIDDEGDLYATVSFGLKSLNLFSSSMVIASNKLMFEDGNEEFFRVSAADKTSLSFTLTNLPSGNLDALITVATKDNPENEIVVKGSIERTSEQQGIVTVTLDPELLNEAEKLRINVSFEDVQSDGSSASNSTSDATNSDTKNSVQAEHWVTIHYNSAPVITTNQTRFTVKPGDVLNIPMPAVADRDNFPEELKVQWLKTPYAPQFTATSSALSISIDKNITDNTSYEYIIEVSDGIDTARQSFVVDVETTAVATPNTPSSKSATSANASASSAKPASSKSGGALGIVSLCLLFPLVIYRAFARRSYKSC